MRGKLTWNYRIIVDDTNETPWYGIHEVYYIDDEPIDHTVSQSSVFGANIEDLNLIMADMKQAFNHPVLKKSQFPPMDDYRRPEWMKVREIAEKI